MQGSLALLQILLKSKSFVLLHSELFKTKGIIRSLYKANLCLGRVTHCLHSQVDMVNLLFERGLRKWKPHSAKVPLIAQSLWKWKVLVLEMLLLFCHIIFNIDIQYFGVRLRSTIIYRCSQMCWGRMNLKIKNRNMQGFLSLHKAHANVAEINDVCLGTLHSFCHMIFDIDIQYLGVRLRSTVIYRH